MALARVYARSLLEVAREEEAAGPIEEELEELVALFDRMPEFERFLASPLVDEEARQEALERILHGRASDLVTDALQVMNRKGRLGLVRAMAAAYRRAHQEVKGEVDVLVETAVPLSDGQRQRVSAAVAGATGRRPQIVERVKAALIGGMVVRVGDQKMDGSVARRLRLLRERLMERASREIQRRRVAEAAEG
jgi:F-type H+-transporting ATPase subunit delta